MYYSSNVSTPSSSTTASAGTRRTSSSGSSIIPSFLPPSSPHDSKSYDQTISPEKSISTVGELLGLSHYSRAHVPISSSLVAYSDLLSSKGYSLYF
jgi:hypothetical protein